MFHLKLLIQGCNPFYKSEVTDIDREGIEEIIILFGKLFRIKFEIIFIQNGILYFSMVFSVE
jgi:hypothetical protein